MDTLCEGRRVEERVVNSGVREKMKRKTKEKVERLCRGRYAGNGTVQV